MGASKRRIVKTAWIEKVLERGADGTLGAAKALNDLTAGGVVPLEFRMIHLEGSAWVLLVKVGEREPVAAKEA